MTAVLDQSTEHQPRVWMVLTAALRAGPSHAYLFRGPRGAGKRAAARAFAAEILAAGAEDPADARRRALLDPSPHPDLVWLAPSGAQHMVEAVRERVIRAAAYRPFEGDKRVFVVEAAEAMRDESQNALLKTLEEPPGFVHLILLSSEPAALLETIVSRCQPVEFAPLPVDAVEAALAGGGAGESGEGASSGGAPPEEIAAAARLAAGDVDLARLLLTEQGRAIRLDAERLVATALGLQPVAGAVAATAEAHGPSADDLPPRTEVTTTPWHGLLTSAEEAGADAEAAAREALEEEAEAGVKRSTRDVADEAKRVGRRRRTEVLDLGLALTAAWFRDLAATVAGASETAFNRDRLEALRSLSAGLDPRRARRAAELVQDTRRRLDLNVSEELALEALFFRIQRGLAGGATR
jgi:DNA polymerase-3 subunit delta'